MSNQGNKSLISGLARYLRNLVGVILKDWLRYRQALKSSDASYLALCNRDQTLTVSPNGKGFCCNWQWTSDLHAPKYMPALGLRLLKRAIADHPIIRRTSPEKNDNKPDITYVIGHRGLQRLPHLLATLESIAGQAGATVECIVIEQDVEACLGDKLPRWVRHIHTPPPARDMPYCRSWTFNIGVKHANADVLVLHDNDMLVSSDYSTEILAKVKDGHDVVNLKRFIFYLDEENTKWVFADPQAIDKNAPEAIVQNNEGGGSIAVTKSGYEAIGGMDETFIGWGGEDNEFWERAQKLRVWPYAHLSLVHLWHAAQAGKAQTDNQTFKHYQTLSTIPTETRILQLRSIRLGEMSGPYGYQSNG